MKRFFQKNVQEIVMASSRGTAYSVQSTSWSTRSSKQAHPPTLVEQSDIHRRIRVLANVRNPALCLSVRLSNDGKYFAVPLSNGTINLFKTKKENMIYKLNEESNRADGAATSVRFRPWGLQNLTPNSHLIATFTNGAVKTFDFPTGSCVHEIKENRGILACEYSKTGDTFATSGDDGVLNVYDDERKRLIISYKPTFFENAKFQRVYSIQYHPETQTEIITGGWDNSIRQYDLRIPHMLTKFSGPQICGEGISFSPSGRQFCTASWRKRDSLQIWDYGSSKLIKTFDSASSSRGGKQSSSQSYKLRNLIPSQMNYSCKYFDESRIVVGGTQDDAVSLVHALTEEVIATIKGLTKSVYAVDAFGTKVAFVTGNEVALIDIFCNSSR